MQSRSPAPCLFAGRLPALLGLGLILLFASRPGESEAAADEKPGRNPVGGAPAGPPVNLVLQLGHYGAVGAVAFSPDGKRVLTGGGDGTARLWDTATGLEMRTFNAQAYVAGMSLSQGGKLVLTGHMDKRPALLWDAATGQQIRSFDGPGGELCFSPDAKTFLSTSADYRDHTLRLWDVASGKEIRTFKGHRDTTLTIEFSPDGKHALTGSRDGTARLWDVATGTEVRDFRLSQVEAQKKMRFTSVLTAALSPNGKYVVTGDTDAVVRLWEVSNGKEVRQFKGHHTAINAVCFSPDGKQIVSGGVDFVARLWDVDSGKLVHSFLGHSGEVLGVAFSPDGKRVATAGTDNTARLWDATTGKGIHAFVGRVQAGTVSSVAFSPDGKSWLMGCGAHISAHEKRPGFEPNSVHQWDAVGGRKVRSIPHAGQVVAVIFAPDGGSYLTYNRRDVFSWHALTGKELHRYQAERKINGTYCAAVSPKGRLLLVAAGTPPNRVDRNAPAVLKVWDLAGEKEVSVLTTPPPPKKVGSVPPPGPRVPGPIPLMPIERLDTAAFSADGKQVVTATSTHVVAGWNAANGNQGKVFGGHSGKSGEAKYSAHGPLCLSPDGKKLLASTFNEEGTFRLWDVESGRELVVFKGHERRPDAFAFSPDGKRVLTGSSDHSARLWDAETGKELHALLGHTHYVTSVAFSPDGKRVLTGSWDETARLWDAATGKELCRLISLADGAWAAVTPDGYYMASRGALPGMAFNIGDRVFTFEQFDVKYNRPDKVLERIGGSPELIGAYAQAYQKRLKRLNFTEEKLGDTSQVPPEVTVAEPPLTTRDKTLKLGVRATDGKFLLDRLHIDVNGVPIRGAAGIDLRQQGVKNWQQDVEIELSAGRNVIDVSVLNEQATESLRRSFVVRCDAPAVKPNLYVVAVGVSDYADARFKLTYADKDARDLATALEGKKRAFDEVKVLRVLNRDATRENVLKAAEFLKPARVEDTVVLFFAGHGLLDAKLNYYFATADIDFADPGKRGLPYEAIEGLLDGTRARKKLLLMDTCHSGELDPDSVQVAKAEKKDDGEVKTRGFRGGLTPDVKPKVGLANSYQLMQEMFADLRRGTGAVVIASAGGAEYAFESAAWSNGVFTHAVLRGLKGEADRDKDGRVQVSELREFVAREVRRLTEGRQSPDTRSESVLYDFSLE